MMATTTSKLFILILCVLVNTPEPAFTAPCRASLFQCGQPAIQPNGQRIVGGTKAQRGAWPWMVLLAENGYTVCGGAIISDQFVLTATHCIIDRGTATTNWKVIAGKTRLDRYEHAQQTAEVSKFIFHKDYNATTLENDITIIKLSNPLSFSTLIQPICLPEPENRVYTGQRCMMAGWGDTKGTTDRMALNQVELPIIDDDVCSKDEWYGVYFFPEKTFCAGYEEGQKDACSGDSGGPLICKDKTKWIVQGIASWGVECGISRWPGIYTEVALFTTWIRETVNAESSSNCPPLGGSS